METFKLVCRVLTGIFTPLMAYWVVYYILGSFKKGKAYGSTVHERRFGIVIAARNEEAVIGKLLDSINAQTYNKEKIRVFVAADNCTDNTAEICRKKGAEVWERHEPQKARKGYALEFLFDKIEKKYGIAAFDAYLFFDADNLLTPNFIAEMNKAYESGADIITGYRNALNFGENFISAAYGIHFLRSNAFSHRPRSLLNISTHVAGTGFAVRSELLLGGWHFYSLTEDTEFTLFSVAAGKRIEYCEKAEFFDEQPTSVKIMLRQRLRWQKGRLFCFFRYAPKLISGLFSGKNKLSCYDMFFYIYPKSMFCAFISLIYTAALLLWGDNGKSAADILFALLSSYAGILAVGAATVVRERKKIRCSTAKLIYYTLLFPLFDLTALPISILSLFMRVKWKPIPHKGGR